MKLDVETRIQIAGTNLCISLVFSAKGQLSLHMPNLQILNYLFSDPTLFKHHKFINSLNYLCKTDYLIYFYFFSKMKEGKFFDHILHAIRDAASSESIQRTPLLEKI